MYYKMKKNIVYNTVFAVIILLKDSDACFQEDLEPYDIYDITTGSPLYKECECTEPGYTVDDLQWLDINGQPITDTESNVHIERNGNKLALLIRSASKTMSGTYKCVTTFNGAVHSQAHKVNIYDPLEFINTEPTQYLSEGDDSLISCQTVGDHEPMIHWFKGENEDIELDTNNDEYYINKSVGLIVKNVTIEDADIYRCLAEERTFGQRVEKIIKVEVLTVPVIKELSARPEAIVSVGEKVSIQCVAQGMPDPEYSWRKIVILGQQARNATWTQINNVIEFESIAADDTGTYECLASNTIGTAIKTITIDVLVRPEIYNFTNRTVVEGKQVMIFCNVTGNPPPEVSVVYEGKSLIEEEEGEDTEYERILENYAVIKVNRSDEGIYVCNATNIVDYETEIMYLKVLHKPYFNKDYDLVWGWNGESVRVSCAHESSPPAKLIWSYQKDITVPSDVNVNNSLNEANLAEHTFLINENFTLFGVFKCKAFNEYGEAHKTIDLVKGYPPSAVQNITAIDITATSATFSIEPSNTFIGPEVIGITAEYDEASNYEITDIHRNRTWSLDRPFKLDKLKPNTTYYVRVAAVNVVGAGEWSDMIAFDTLEKSSPERPVWPDSPLKVSSSGYLLKWKAPEENGDPIDYYILRYCPIYDRVDEELCKVVRIMASTELELSNLEYNTSYRLELVAHNSEGNSTTAEVIVTVPARLEDSQAPMLSAGILIAISVVVVVTCLVVLDLILFFWRKQGLIASCCHKNNKRKKADNLNSRDKKGLLKDNKEADDTLRRPNNGHKEYEYNKSTGIITGKHSAV